MNTKAFTLIEIIFVLLILSILTAIGVNSFQVAQLKKQQQTIVESIISYSEKAKADTQAGQGGVQHGIKFNTQDFVLFSGSSFSSGNSENKIVTIHSQFEISTTFSNSQNILLFSKLYGEPNEVGTITISHIDDRVEPISFTIDQVGSISMIE